MSIYLLKIFSWTGEVAKVHESKFHETLLSVSGYFRMKFVSPVCAEGTSPFIAVAQRLKIVQLRNVKKNFKNSLGTEVPGRVFRRKSG